MVVGIDVHKRSHTAALVDELGGVLASLTFANGHDGAQRLVGWLAAHDAQDAVVGLENAANYGMALVGVLAAAGHEVLDVPPWRTHRERPELAPGKSDVTDAVAIAQVVARNRSLLASAREPELVRAIALLDRLRRQAVLDRTQTIQRLRALWTQVDPESEKASPKLTSRAGIAKAKRVRLGAGIDEQAAQRCIYELACQTQLLSDRIRRLQADLHQLLAEHGNPVAQIAGAGPGAAATLIAQAGDVRRFRNRDAFARFCGAAPIPCGSGSTSGRHRLHRGGNRQINATLHRIAVTQARCYPPAQAYLTRKRASGKTAREARRALKRHLANTVYRQLLTWAQTTLPTTTT